MVKEPTRKYERQPIYAVKRPSEVWNESAADDGIRIQGMERENRSRRMNYRHARIAEIFPEFMAFH